MDSCNSPLVNMGLAIVSIAIVLIIAPTAEPFTRVLNDLSYVPELASICKDLKRHKVPMQCAQATGRALALGVDFLPLDRPYPEVYAIHFILMLESIKTIYYLIKCIRCIANARNCTEECTLEVEDLEQPCDKGQDEESKG